MAIRYPQRYDDDFLNTIKTIIDHVNAHGKTIQDLVAEGQLTEEEYARLIAEIHKMAKSGEIGKDDLSNEFKAFIDSLELGLSKKADKQEMESKLASKVDKGGNEQITWAMLQQSVKENITGGSTPVVGEESVNTSNLIDGAVTFEKTNFSKEVSLRLKNIIQNSDFSSDTDGDGLADGWGLSANGDNPRIQNGRQYWDSSATFAQSGGLRGDVKYSFKKSHSYFVRFNQKNVSRVYFDQLNDRTPNVLVDGIYRAGFIPEETAESRVSIHTRNEGEAYISNLLIIDLSETFGLGNEPSTSYVEYLINIFTDNSWFDDTLNLLDASNNGVITAKELKVYDPNNEMSEDDVNGVLTDLNADSERSLKVKSGGNLYNPQNNVTGNVVTVDPNNPLEVDDDSNYVSQSLKIDRSKNMTLRGIRSYTLSNAENIVVQRKELIDVDESHTIYVSDIPDNAYYIWLTTYPENAETSAQLELGDNLSVYETYEEVGGVYFKDEKLFDVPVKNGDVQSLHDVSLAKLENERLNEEVEILKSNTEALFNIKMPKASEIKEVSLNSNEAQKLILHFHKRENDGYDMTNDVFLPTAENDFSDIKISDGKGKSLSYKVVHSTNSFDIVPDSRVNGREKLENSHGELLGIESDYIAKSVDKGKTWERVAALDSFHDININLVTHDDTLIFNHDNKIYRSEHPYDNYEEAFTLPSGYTFMQVRPKGMVQHPNGEIFFGTYQLEHAIYFFKSEDDGRTWTKSFEELGTYQHTHGMYVDAHSDPVAVYAGVDRGGGIFKTTDKGATWVDLRENNEFPQATDFGVRYADPSGYRLLTGETTIVGGYSILKTTDDVNFKPVLGTGAQIHYIYKMDGKLFAGGAGTRGYRHAVVYMSEDEGETWEAVYNTAPLNNSDGANDGFREMSQLDDQLLVGVQGPTYPLRIFPEGYYAEVVVDVPENTDKVVVETGYAYTNKKPIYNDEIMEGEHLVKFNFNEGGRVIKESVSGKYFEDDYEWVTGGKHLSYFYPFITSPSENNSMPIKSLNGYKVPSSDFDVSEGITISFWGKISDDTNIELFRTDGGYSLEFYNGNRLRKNGELIIANVNEGILPGRFVKIDWVISEDGTMKEYVNGQFTFDINERREGGIYEIVTALNDSNELNLLTNLNENATGAIQHFSIRKGVISSEQLFQEFNSHVSDNFNR